MRFTLLQTNKIHSTFRKLKSIGVFRVTSKIQVQARYKLPGVNLKPNTPEKHVASQTISY